VVAGDKAKFDDSYLAFILTMVCLGFVFFFCGITIRQYYTTAKGRTQRGIITGMLLPEDTV